MRIPHLFQHLAAFWELSPAQMYHLWLALEQARWSRSAGWKRALTAPAHAHAGLNAMLAHPCFAPRAIVLAVEALVGEGRLSRATAVPVEAHILGKVTSAGTWRGLPTAVWPVGDIPGVDVVYAIEEYWR